MADANSTGITVNVTPSEVRAALKRVVAEYPELGRAMEIAETMILRLQTRMDEANLGMCYACQQGISGLPKRHPAASKGPCIAR